MADRTCHRKLNPSWISEIKKRHDAQMVSRKAIKSSEFDESKLRSLDSTLKKTTAFMKKLKNIGAGAGPSLIEEMRKLNLSKFVEEMAQGITECKIKLSDVAFVVDLCVAVSCRYPKFSELLLIEIRKSLPLKKNDKITNPSKLRVDLRFLCELFLHGIFGKEGLQAFGQVLCFLTLTDKVDHFNVGLICSIASVIGWEMAEIISKDAEGEENYEVAGLPLSEAISTDQRKTVRDSLTAYHTSLMEHTNRVCIEMNKIQRKVKRQERTRGDGAQEDKASLELLKEKFDTLKQQSSELSYALGIKMPDWKEEPSDDEEDELSAIQIVKALDDGEISLWPDEETRGFYENIIQIKKMVPSNLFKESEECTIVNTAEMASTIDDVDLNTLDMMDDEDLEIKEEKRTSSENMNYKESSAECDYVLPHEIEVVDSEGAELILKQMNNFVKDLGNMINRDAVDNMALDFVSNLNTKINRKKLVRVLFTYSKQRIDLLPFFARLVATLKPVMPDVPLELAQLLIQQFRDMNNGSLQREFLDNKIKSVVFISELVKFCVIPRAEALNCLRLLVYDFRGHSVEMTCAMIETCGNYLYRNPESHSKMKILLEVILKKKNKIKDSRQEMLIDNAYFTVCPPEGGMKRQPQRPPMQAFIRNLIINMNETTIDDNLRYLRRLNWLNSEISDYTVNLLSSPWLLSFSQLLHLASALSGLSHLQYHEWTAVEVVDNVLETIRMALEQPGAELNQMAISCVTYLGELYNYEVVSSEVVFKTLYQLISFPEESERWEDFTRIRMVGQLVRTVSEYFQNGTAKKKMDAFLTYFNRYFWSKRQQWLDKAKEIDPEDTNPIFSPELIGDYEEVIRLFRKGELSKSLEDAERAVEALQEGFKDRIDQLISGVPMENVSEEDDGPRHHSNRLEEIREEEEDEYEQDSESISDREFGAVGMMDIYDDYEEKVHVNLHKESVAQPEDDDFMRDLDKMIMENARITSAPSTTHADITVPEQAKQKLNRKLTFVEGPSTTRSDQNLIEDNCPKVTIMTRGKGNKPVLRVVEMNEERLEKQWMENREKEKREREQLKRVTLGLTQRMAEQEEYGEFPPLS